MSYLRPTLNSISPAGPIIIVINPITQTGQSGNLQLKYTVTNSSWLPGQPTINFNALLQTINTPYRVVGGMPNVTRSELLTQQSDTYTFDFSLETTAPIIGTAIAVRLKLCVYDIADVLPIQQCHLHPYLVTLQ